MIVFLMQFPTLTIHFVSVSIDYGRLQRSKIPTSEINLVHQLYIFKDRLWWAKLMSFKNVCALPEDS